MPRLSAKVVLPSISRQVTESNSGDLDRSGCDQGGLIGEISHIKTRKNKNEHPLLIEQVTDSFLLSVICITGHESGAVRHGFYSFL